MPEFSGLYAPGDGPCRNRIFKLVTSSVSSVDIHSRAAPSSAPSRCCQIVNRGPSLPREGLPREG